MGVVRWTFADDVLRETRTFSINPKQGGSPTRKRNVGSSPTTAPDGVRLVYEGRRFPDRIEFAGLARSQAEHEAFVEWFSKRHPITLTDDLGRSFRVYLKQFAPKRAPLVGRHWRQEYACVATVVT